MTGDLHNNRFRHAGFAHISIKTMTGIMIDESALCPPSIWDSDFFTCIYKRRPDVPNRFTFEQENTIFVYFLIVNRFWYL